MFIADPKSSCSLLIVKVHIYYQLNRKKKSAHLGTTAWRWKGRGRCEPYLSITNCEGLYSSLIEQEQEKENYSPGDSCLAVERAGKMRALSLKP